MRTLLTIHGELRWLVAMVAVIAGARFGLGLVLKLDYGRWDRILMTVLTVLLDLNLVMGLILLFGLGGGWPAFRLEHAGTMILAVAAAHSSAAWRRSTDSRLKFRNNLVVVLIVLVLVVVGVVRLRGGWMIPR